MTNEQEKSDLFVVAMKLANKPWATGRGVGGAKEEDRGEHRRATHVPDSEPGKRVPEARLGTRSCSWSFVVRHLRWEPGA